MITFLRLGGKRCWGRIVKLIVLIVLLKLLMPCFELIQANLVSDSNQRKFACFKFILVEKNHLKESFSKIVTNTFVESSLSS